MKRTLIFIVYLIAVALIGIGITYWSSGSRLIACAYAGAGLWIAVSFTYGLVNWRRISAPKQHEMSLFAESFSNMYTALNFTMAATVVIFLAFLALYSLFGIYPMPFHWIVVMIIVLMVPFSLNAGLFFDSFKAFLAMWATGSFIFVYNVAVYEYAPDFGKTDLGFALTIATLSLWVIVPVVLSIRIFGTPFVLFGAFNPKNISPERAPHRTAD